MAAGCTITGTRDHGDPNHGDPDHGHGLTEAERLAMAEALWRQETLRLVTVGIDIGSSTSHLVFARVLFQRQGHRAPPGSCRWSGWSTGARRSC